MPSTPRLRRSLSPSSAGRKHGSPPVSPSGGRGSLERTPRCRGLRPGAHSPVEKMPLRASASALQAKPGSPSGSTKAALEAEVAALRSQLSDQAESHQADMSALHAEQAMRRAALEESVRAEAAEAERVLCLQFADEACAYKVQTSRALEEAQACARAASRREMRALRRQLEGRAGLILLCGPPCGGKSLLAEALSAQLEIPHASLPTLLEEGAAAAGADGEKLRTALQEGAPLPPGVLLRLVLRAASLAQAGLMLLECPAHSALLPSLLLRLPPPLLLLLVDAPDAVCLRRMKHRSRAAGALGPDTAGMPALSPASLPPPSASALLLGSEEEGAPRARHSGEHGVDGAGGAADFPLPGTPTHGRGSGHMVDLLHRYRATDERVARALGQRYPGRLCVLDERTPPEEIPTILTEAIVSAAASAPCLGIGTAAEPPILVVDSLAVAEGRAPSEAAAVARAMAAEWGLTSLEPTATRTAEATLTLLRSHAKAGRRCVLSAPGGAALEESVRAFALFAPDRAKQLASAAAPSSSSPSSSSSSAAAAVFLLNEGRSASGTPERSREVLRGAGLRWTVLPSCPQAEPYCTPRPAATASAASQGGDDARDGGEEQIEACLAHAAEVLAELTLGLARDADPDNRSRLAYPCRQEVESPAAVTASLAGGASGAPPPFGSLRGVVIISGAAGPLCAQLAAELGGAHILLSALLREHIEPPKAAAAREDGVGRLRSGKLVASSSVVRALEGAVHASPERLVIIEHTRCDAPLDSLLGSIRPALVLLVRHPPQKGSPAPTSSSVLTLEGRLAHEEKTVREVASSLGDHVTAVQLCGGEAAEASRLVCGHLRAQLA